MERKTKKDIRSEVKKHRREASVDEIYIRSEKICDAFLALDEYKEAPVVFAYIDCKNEVQTKKVIEQCWKDNKVVAVPKVFGDVMHFYTISSFADLEEGYFGIREPKNTDREPIICENALMILPGVAFDLQRHRVGYGGGFYDKYLELHSNLKKIAFAFEFQIYDKVPYESFDQQPEKVITEKRIII
jgi:5-formyltetrahydrofolate cyclo-ligase